MELVQAVRDLSLRGGKRLRPALLVAGYRAVSPSAPLEIALDAGVALELLQTFFLIHDDWMDQDAVRRGGPTVHASLSERYRSEHLGASAAILAGDLALALGTDVLSRLDVPPGRVARATTRFASMQSDAISAQQLDLLGSPLGAEKTCELKTASYTVRGPLALGAILAGGTDRHVDAFDRFGSPIGVAFQLRDDLLSSFGDPKRTGKPIVNDLRNGKRTALVERALELAGRKDRALLERVLGNAKARAADLRAAVGVLEASGARASVEARIESLIAEGLAELDRARLPRARTELLRSAAEILANRRS